jgi:hypothetical protein
MKPKLLNMGSLIQILPTFDPFPLDWKKHVHLTYYTTIYPLSRELQVLNHTIVFDIQSGPPKASRGAKYDTLGGLEGMYDFRNALDS